MTAGLDRSPLGAAGFSGLCTGGMLLAGVWTLVTGATREPGRLERHRFADLTSPDSAEPVVSP